MGNTVCSSACFFGRRVSSQHQPRPQTLTIIIIFWAEIVRSARSLTTSTTTTTTQKRAMMLRSGRGDHTAEERRKVAIIGGGLQGCATAYYLRELGFEGDVTIIERTGIASAASGKGGGFLARHWGSRKTKALHETSFDLHASLARQLHIESYRAIPTLEVTGELGLREWPPVERTAKPIKKSPLHPGWLDDLDTKAKLMDDATAQVAPAELCQKLFDASGASLALGAATGLELDEETGTVLGVRFAPESTSSSSQQQKEEEDARVIPCDECVVALGAWSVLLEDWLPAYALPMEGVYSSSIVFDANADVRDEPRALFCAEDSNSCHLEVYPRPDGTVYICGLGGSDHVRGARLREGGDLQDAAKMRPDPRRVAAATRSFSSLAPAFAGVEPKTTQACMRPCAPDALPLIGKLAAWPNLAVATGHNCWGILWAPITGKVVAELILGREPSVDLSAFSPDRFMPRAAKRGRAVGETQRVGEQW